MRLLVVAIWMLPYWALAQVHHYSDSRQRRSAQEERSCAVCGETGPSVVPWPDKKFSLDGIPLETCGQVEATGTLLTEGTAFCDVLQTVGPLCGCAVSPTACSLCWDGSDVANPRLELPSYPAADFLATSLPDVLLTCEMLDSILKTRNDANEDQCWNARLDVGDICGCPPLPMELDVPRPNNNNNNNNSTAGSNTTQPSQDTVGERDESSDTSQDRCSLCPNGERPGNPDKPLNLVSSTMYTCSDWDRFASITAADSEDCSWFHAYATYCGCQVEETFCNLCPHGESVPKPDQPLNWYHTGFVSTRTSHFHAALDPDYLTCDVMQSKVANVRSANAALLGLEPEFFCLSVQLKSSICGCRPDWRPILLTWSYRLSGILSFIGSYLIIYDVVSRSKNRFTAYHQLVLGISIFDCISSMAYILVGVLAPYEAGFYQSLGNDTTCKLQGFMIQLGQTSMFYNLCLSLYFLLVVRFNWKEHQIKIWKWVAHGAVLTVGFGMAFGALPYVGSQFGVCGILPPLTAHQWQVSLFYTVPVCIVLFVLTAVTVVICLFVYKKHRRVRKWVVRSNRKLSLTRKVLWQSVWYVMAFYLTLPCVLVTFYVDFKTQHHFWLLVVAAVLAPLQGLMNALIYFKRSGVAKILGCLQKLRFGTCCCPSNATTSSVNASNVLAETTEESRVVESKVCERGSAATNSQFDMIRSSNDEEAETGVENLDESNTRTISLSASDDLTISSHSRDRRHNWWWQSRGVRFGDRVPSLEGERPRLQRFDESQRFGADAETTVTRTIRRQRSSTFLGVVEYWDLNEQG